MANSSKGSVMRSAVPNTNSPFRTRPKHVKLSPCPIEISPQHRTNSLDANVAHHGVFQHTVHILQLPHPKPSKVANNEVFIPPKHN